ncbi:hypothetical protein Hanom_Chr09g00838721 [Helianthus anomalus]
MKVQEQQDRSFTEACTRNNSKYGNRHEDGLLQAVYPPLVERRNCTIRWP